MIDYRISTHDFVYRCSQRECLVKIIVPVDGNYDNCLRFLDKDNLRNIFVDGEHTCEPKIQKFDVCNTQTSFISIQSIKHDISFLKESIRLFPFRSTNFFYNEMVKANQRFTKEEIRKYVCEIRNQYYPNDETLVYDEKYCQTMDKVQK